MKSTDRPKPLDRSYEGVSLTAEEGFVLSRIDGRLTMKDLVDLTGIEERRVDAIVARLAQKGMVAVPALAPPPVDLMPLSDEEKETLPVLEEVVEDEPVDDLQAALAFARLPSDAPPATAEGAPAELSYEKAAYEREKRESEIPPDPTEEQLPELEEVGDEEGAEAETAAAAEVDEPTGEADEQKAFAEPQTYRQLYEGKYRHLEPGARANYALTAVGADIYALCFDPDPKIIQALLQNHRIGLAHARFIATWHSTAQGLELVSTRHEFFKDGGVQRRLLRNTHLSESMLKRVIQPKRLGEIFKASMDKDIPQLTRTRSRGVLRQKFTGMSQPEERVELIVQTEGRCLPLLVGCTFDGRTTQMLCARQYNSMIFVQNLAKFPACPPTLLAHLIKQPSVRRNQAMKRLLLQHKNMPSEAKKYA